MTMKRTMSWSLVAVAVLAGAGAEQRAQSQGGLRIALLRQPFVPNGASDGPATMANGGIQPRSKSWARPYASSRSG